MKEVILGIWLVILAGFDFKAKEIPLWLSVLGGVIGIGFCIVEKRALGDLVLSCIPGIILLGVSWITKEVIGYGDGIVFVVLGTYLSISKLVSIGMLAFFVAGIVALVLLVVFRKNGRYRMPFVPFLVIAYGLGHLMQLGGM